MPLRQMFVLALALCAMPGRGAIGQSAADSAAVMAASMDYIDGYWERDTARLSRGLHPELAKRQVVSSRTGAPDRISPLTTERMINSAVRSAGNPPNPDRQSDVRILHMFGNMATVVVDAGAWLDYMHLARWNGQYRIFNIMYDFRRAAPNPAPAGAPRGLSAADSAAVIAASLDYIDGLWESDSTRVRRSLHPELVKRQALAGRDGAPDRLTTLTADTMVVGAGRRAGRPAPATRLSDVKILHMFGNMATVVIDAGAWVDYLHLARWNGEYKIFNVMFDFRRPARTPGP
jgi:hypothetical protein